MLHILLLLLSPMINFLFEFSFSSTNWTHFTGCLSCIPAATTFAKEMDSSINCSIMTSSRYKASNQALHDSLKTLMHYQSLGWPSLSQDNYILCVQVFHNSNIWNLSTCSHLNHLWNSHSLYSRFHQSLDSLDTFWWVRFVPIFTTLSTCSLELNIESCSQNFLIAIFFLPLR